MKFTNRLEITLASAALALLLAGGLFIRGGATAGNIAIDEINPPPATLNLLAKAVLRELAETPQYLELNALYKKSKPASARQRRILAALKILRTEAMGATTVDPENPEVRVVNYIDGDGPVVRFTSMIPGNVDTNERDRDDMAAAIAGFIIDDAVNDGLIPFDLPPDTQKLADAAMSKGYAAAEQKDYSTALRHFEEARVLAPHAAEVYYNLAMAESKISGRELRATIWFGAYMAVDPGSSLLASIQEQVRKLEWEGPARFIGLMEEIAAQTSNYAMKEAYLIELSSLRAHAGDVEASIGNKHGDILPVSLRYWVAMNDTLLNTPLFMDPASHMKTLPQDTPSATWESFKGMAYQITEMQGTINHMLKAQEERRKLL